VDEYLESKSVQEVGETLTEMIDSEKQIKHVCVGHFILWGLTKSPKQFLDIKKLIKDLHKEKIVTEGELGEAYISRILICH